LDVVDNPDAVIPGLRFAETRNPAIVQENLWIPAFAGMTKVGFTTVMS
jgi:hypothetical protein